MISAIKTIGRFCRLFRRKEDGGPTIEFVLVFMPFMVVTISGFEMGLMMTRHVMMERGLDLAIRDVRLSTGDQIDEDDLKILVCNYAGILQDCTNKVYLEMVNIDLRDSAGVGPSTIDTVPSCTDVLQPFETARTFTNGTSNEMMVLRSCGLWTPMLPEFGLGFFLSRLRDDRFYPLISTSAFVMEPL